MKKLLSSFIAIVVLLFFWINIKDQSTLIDSGFLALPKNKTEILDLASEKIVIDQPVLNKQPLPISSLNFDLNSSGQKTLIAHNEKNLTKEAMEKYLRESSSLNFPDNTEVSLALFDARDGNKFKMELVVKSFKEKIPKLEAMVPPLELKDFHEKSLSAIKDYLSALEKILQNAGNKEKILEILNSAQMNSARNTAREILIWLREIVAKYNLQISTEVLPKDKIPAPTP